MKTQTQIFSAAVLGTIAFKNGLKRVPCLDSELNKLIANNKIGESIPVLKAWVRAWDNANLYGTKLA